MAPLLRSSGVRTRPRDGMSIRKLAHRTWKEVLADRVFGHAAELGFYFAFALFPTLLCGATLLGFMARSAHRISDELIENLALVIPNSALDMVLNTFNETAAAASSGKLTFGSITAIWSASIGVSAIQDTLNAVFKIEDRRSYIKARVQAILVTMLLIVVVGSGLGFMLFGDFVAALAERRIVQPVFAIAAGVAIRIVAWAAAGCLLALSFAILYYWAPDWRQRHWRWLTPGTVLGIAGWLLASYGFRFYLEFFNSFTVTYGSLGAMIILLMWFYISGLMLLVGAEIDFVIRDASADAQLANLPAAEAGLVIARDAPGAESSDQEDRPAKAS
jgi:membrane protein